MTRVPAATRHQPWLVGDIGGTNARFALVDEPGASPRNVRNMVCADFPDLAGAAEAYLGTTSASPVAACIAVAGPVGGDRFRLTNGGWDFSLEATQYQLGLAHLELINDFAALALSLPHLGTAELRAIGTVSRVPGLPQAVLGPGTGLGVAGLLPAGDRWLPVCGEGGHVDLPVVEEREIEVFRILKAEQQAVTAECMLSGGGLTRLHRCLSRLEGVEYDALSPSRITELGRSREDELCVETLDLFCALLGGVAGNVALTLGARGGVYLGGGILPRIPEVLERSAFRDRFEAKLRMADYVKAISTHLITASTPALTGAAAHLRQQQTETAAASSVLA